MSMNQKTPTGLRLDCLAVASGIQERKETPYGMAIRRGVENLSGTHLQSGRFYSILNELVEDGYLSKKELDGRTNSYSITNEGLGVLNGRVGGLQEAKDGKMTVKA